MNYALSFNILNLIMLNGESEFNYSYIMLSYKAAFVSYF